MKAESSLNGKELSAGTLAGPIHVKTVGSFGPTLDSTQTGSKVIKLVVSEPWIIVTVKADGGKQVTVPIPITSFTHTVLA